MIRRSLSLRPSISWLRWSSLWKVAARTCSREWESAWSWVREGYLEVVLFGHGQDALELVVGGLEAAAVLLEALEQGQAVLHAPQQPLRLLVQQVPLLFQLLRLTKTPSTRALAFLFSSPRCSFLEFISWPAATRAAISVCRVSQVRLRLAMSRRASSIWTAALWECIRRESASVRSSRMFLRLISNLSLVLWRLTCTRSRGAPSRPAAARTSTPRCSPRSTTAASHAHGLSASRATSSATISLPPSACTRPTSATGETSLTDDYSNL